MPLLPDMNVALVEVATERPGLNVHLGPSVGSAASPAWTVGGWSLRFVRLAPGASLALDPAEGEHHAKVVTGALVEPARRVAYAPDRTVAGTRVDGGHVTAGPEGALLAHLVRLPGAPARVTSMDQLAFGGPHAELLTWITFEQRYPGLEVFAGVDAHQAPGFHLLDDEGAEIAYVWVWTAGKGADLSTHDHGRAPGPRSPAFAEVHWVLANGTGLGGMYETPAPGAPERERLPVPAGCEHGPYFRYDAATGAPRLRDNGAVDYPWHGWQGGDDGAPGQAYDVVVPFEITVPYARVTG